MNKEVQDGLRGIGVVIIYAMCLPFAILAGIWKLLVYVGRKKGGDVS